jgi:hypothetical protein
VPTTSLATGKKQVSTTKAAKLVDALLGAGTPAKKTKAAIASKAVDAILASRP